MNHCVENLAVLHSSQMLDGSGKPHSKIKLWGNNLSSLPNLKLIRNITSIDNGTSCTNCGPKNVGSCLLVFLKNLHSWESFLPVQTRFGTSPWTSNRGRQTQQRVQRSNLASRNRPSHQRSTCLRHSRHSPQLRKSLQPRLFQKLYRSWWDYWKERQ